MRNDSLRSFGWMLIAAGALSLSCAPEDTGPATGTGGAPSTGSGGAAPGSSGGSSSGGSPGSSSGGAPSSTGGSSNTGGAASGGSATGGRAASGGAGGYAPGTGGRSGTGGRAGGTGGATGMGGGSSPGVGGGSEKSAGCGMTGAPTSNTYTISVGGANRTYILKVPTDYDANKAYRLIFSFHWLNGTAQNVSSGNYYGLWSLSQGSTIFVAPQGNNNAWNDNGKSSTAGGEDIKFTQALYTEMTNKFCIDKKRVFAEGFSMGGSMSYAVACAMGEQFRAVVAHSGGPMSGCVNHSKPVAYFMTHGTQDSVCKYPMFGVPQINDFAKVNGCGTQAMPMPSGSEHLCVDFPGCMSGYPARACIFVGDHTASPPGNWVPMESWKFISQF